MTSEDHHGGSGRGRRIEPRIDWTRGAASDPAAPRVATIPAWRDRRHWRWGAGVAVLFIVLVAIQAPFVYRYFKFGQLKNKIIVTAKISREVPRPTNEQFTEYKGIIHAHTSLGGHSTGRFEELIDASHTNELDFVIMTEHYAPNFDTAALTLNGVYGKTLFVGGNEIDTGDADRFLMIPGSADSTGLAKVSTAGVIEKLHAENRLALVTYPEKFNFWNSNFDGIEVFSLHTAAKKMNPFIAFFDLIWSGFSYPELVFSSTFRPRCFSRRNTQKPF